MSDKTIEVVIQKANVMRSDYVMFTPESCRLMAERLNELFPGQWRYDEESESVIYHGPESNLKNYPFGISTKELISPREEPPTEPGIYYYVDGRCKPGTFLICQVAETKGSGLFGEICSPNFTRFYSYESVLKMKGRWFGPLPRPLLRL